jgi:DNA topoisomerase-3
MRQVERNLQNEARTADLLIIWTDCDREGEHIGWEVAQVCIKANRRLKVKRARFSAIIAA